MASKIRRTVTVGHTPSGKCIKMNFCGKTKKEVQKKIDDYKIQQATGYLEPLDEITMTQWADEWLSIYKENTVCDGTYEMYKLAVKHIEDYFGSIYLSMIRPIDIQKFYKKHSKKSQSALNKIHITLLSIFKTAIANGYLTNNPLDDMPRPVGQPAKEKHVWTIDQAETVFDFAMTHRFGHGPALILKPGLRRGELMGLIPLFDIDLEKGRLSMRRTVTDVNGIVNVKDGGKSEAATRTIPLDPECIDWMKNDMRFHQDGFLFHVTRGHRTGQVLSPHSWYQRQFYDFMSDLTASHPDIPRLNPHELRHTYGTLLYDAGTDIYTIQKVMGHADIKVTAKIYVHGDIEAVENNIRFPVKKTGAPLAHPSISNGATVPKIQDF